MEQLTKNVQQFYNLGTTDIIYKKNLFEFFLQIFWDTFRCQNAVRMVVRLRSTQRNSRRISYEDDNMKQVFIILCT